MPRRDAVIGAFAAGILRGIRTSILKATQLATTVNFTILANACDCHARIFGDPAKFPCWPVASPS
jgi:hypothetical protein